MGIIKKKLKKIKNKEEFHEWIVDTTNISFERNEYFVDTEDLYIEDFYLDEENIDNKSFRSTTFERCTFKSCIFNSVIFQSCTFISCTFLASEFYWSKFLESDLFACEFKFCTIADLELADVDIKNTEFNDCNEILDLRIRGMDTRIITFNSSYIHHMSIEPIKKSEDEFNFINCLIKESSFDRLNLVQSVFEDCSLSLNQFSSCEFSDKTFSNENNTPGNEFNMLDIRTILNSQPIDKKILENIFGINNADIKDYLIDLTSKIDFQSIFISYSFEDKVFANTINNFLTKRGILTFLWENDSPAGKSLNSIMTSNIREKDRVLFIASKDSIKSKACQFELTSGRQKQEITWENVLFPIHIDNFLFEIEKTQIRPIEKQNEYWKNIEELKKLNSLDFSNFVNTEKIDEHKFEKLIYRLIKGLRK